MKTNLKLLNDLYIIKDILEDSTSKTMTIQIELNSTHSIFRGHFPGNPVLPGVCTVQILKELLIYQSGKNLHLVKARSIKYLAFINPLKNNVVNFTIHINKIKNDHLFCDASIYFNTTVFCSFKGEFMVLAI